MSDFLEDVLGPKLSGEERERVRSIDPFLKAKVKSQVKSMKTLESLGLAEFDPAALEGLMPEEERTEQSLEGFLNDPKLQLFSQLREVFGPDFMQHPLAQELIYSQLQNEKKEETQKTAIRRLDELRRL